jgi:hypothetical protein
MLSGSLGLDSSASSQDQDETSLYISDSNTFSSSSSVDTSSTPVTSVGNSKRFNTKEQPSGDNSSASQKEQPSLTSSTSNGKTANKMHRLSAKERRYIQKHVAQERLKRYSANHLKTDIFALGKVQRSVINIQRIMRGKLAREQYFSLQNSKYALMELLLFLVYLSFHVWFAILRKDNVDMFYLSKMMEDGIVHEEFPGPAGGGGTYIKKTFLDVATVEEFWDYLEGPFRANVFPEKCRDPDYNGIPCLGAMNDVNHLVGTVRMRQFRVDETPGCPLPNVLKVNSLAVEQKCYGSWRTRDSSMANFSYSDRVNRPKKSWNKAQNDSIAALSKDDPKFGDLLTCFVFEDRSTTGLFTNQYVTGGWVYSDAGLVSGTVWDAYPAKKGYKCDFHPKRDPLKKLNALKEFHWVDDQTRAVLVELTVYNKPTNLFSSMRLVFEFPTTGGIQPYYEPYTGFLFSGLKPSIYYQELITLALIDVMTLGFMLQEFGELKQSGLLNYFSSLWNALDWFNYVFLALVTFFFFDATLEAQYVLGKTDYESGEFLDIFNLVYKYRWIDYFFSVNMIAVFLKMLKYVRLSPKLSIVSETLTSTISQSAGFFVIFLMLLAAYALAFWFTYGQLIFEFRTLSNSFVS